jgi:hypothetical protein
MVVVDDGTVHFYMDDKLDRSLEKIKKRVTQKDQDYFFAVDGEEGSGKSTFTMQLARRVDPSFCLDRVVFNGKDFELAIKKATKGQAVVFDEAFRGLSSRAALSETNRILVSVMMECRQKNLFVFIVLPSFFMLDKYVVLHRSKGLFHLYTKREKRGYWVFFNKKKKKLLYLLGRATYSYSSPKSSFRGRFLDQYVVDEMAYREKKSAAFNTPTPKAKSQVFLEQRNALLWFLNREVGWSTTVISDRLREHKLKLQQNSVSEAIVAYEEGLAEKGVLQK